MSATSHAERVKRSISGTLKDAGQRTALTETERVEENLELFERMKNGEFADGSQVLQVRR